MQENGVPQERFRPRWSICVLGISKRKPTCPSFVANSWSMWYKLGLVMESSVFSWLARVL